MNYVQSNYGAANPTTSQAVVLSTNVAVGDLILVAGRFGATFGTISDNLGNTYTACANNAADFKHFYSIATTGGACTVTATQSSGRLGVAVHHYSGADAAPVDQSTVVGTGTASTSSTTASFTTSVADGVVFASWGGSVTPTPEADYGGANLQGNGTGRNYSCHRLFTATLTTESVAWTHASATTQFKADSFKSAAVAVGSFAPAPNHPMAHMLVR